MRKTLYLVRHCNADGQEPEAALTGRWWPDSSCATPTTAGVAVAPQPSTRLDRTGTSRVGLHGGCGVRREHRSWPRRPAAGQRNAGVLPRPITPSRASPPPLLSQAEIHSQVGDIGGWTCPIVVPAVCIAHGGAGWTRMGSVGNTREFLTYRLREHPLSVGILRTIHVAGTTHS